MRMVNFTCNFSVVSLAPLFPGPASKSLPCLLALFYDDTLSYRSVFLSLAVSFVTSLGSPSRRHVPFVKAQVSPCMVHHSIRGHVKTSAPWSMSPPMKRAMIEVWSLKVLFYILLIFKITFYVVCYITYIYSKMQYIYIDFEMEILFSDFQN